MRRFQFAVVLALTMITMHAAPSVAMVSDDGPLAGHEDGATAIEIEAPGPADLYPVSVLDSSFTDGINMELDPATGHIVGVRWIADQIVTLDLAGNELDSWGVSGSGSGQLSTPTGLAIDGDLVYIADLGNDRVQIFTKDGDLVDSWGSTGAGPGELNGPCDVEIVGTKVYVSDVSNQRIQVFTRQGGFLDQFGSGGAGDGQLSMSCWGGSLAHYGGEIFVTDRGNDRIAVFDVDGNWERNFGAGTLDEPTGISVDDDGVVWVVSYAGQNLTAWSRLGAPLATIGEAGTTLGTFDLPAAVIADPGGRTLWVRDLGGTGRLQVFTSVRCAGSDLTHVGSSFEDTFRLGPENDVVALGEGNDTAITRGGDDIVCGGPGNDTIKTGAGSDIAFGHKGRDSLFGGGGNDILEGSQHRDTLNGGFGSDTLKGGSENDTLNGNNGPDTLFGGSQDDALNGNKGNDNLRGGAGNDTCRGGAGNDTANSCESQTGIDLLDGRLLAYRSAE